MGKNKTQENLMSNAAWQKNRGVCKLLVLTLGEDEEGEEEESD
jgi:hypothetical protein